MIVIPGYQVSEKLYDGSHSIVYRGHRNADHLPVVLKILKRDYPTPEEMARFRREYDITRSLKIRGVIEAYGMENYGNSLMMVLEDFGGLSLREALMERKLLLRQFLHLAIKMTAILGEIHQQNVIHKDINPANTIWNPRTDEIKFIDFGISTLLSRENPVIQGADVLEGTLAYISPEQTGRMNRAIDYRTDFYSLGVTFYRMLTRQLPFESSDPLELVHAHIAKIPTPPCELDSWGNAISAGSISKAVSDIITKLLAKTAEERYQSAFGLKADLEECLTQLSASGHLEAFRAGQRDVCDKFQIPQKLYGRGKEIEAILAAFDRVSQGRNEMLLVAGYSGIGKSALVHEVHKPIVEKRGYFISGKFEQFKRNIPYASLIQAFQELMRQILTEHEERIADWRRKLLKALGPNGQIVIEVIPEVKLIIGEQPPVPELPPAEAQNRFNLVFQNFVRTFAGEDHPLVIFLDDLQWTDSPSLKLLELLVTDPYTSHMFIIGAYRDNEVGAGSPLLLMLDEIKNAGAKITTITLQPLHLGNVNRLIADTLSAEMEKTEPLAVLCYQKTDGNPFFLNQFLIALHKSKLLAFDLERGVWNWKVEEIRRAEMTDNVIELMAGKIGALSEGAQQVLTLAACIGNQFELKTLSLVHDKSQAETAGDLWEALQEDLATNQLQPGFSGIRSNLRRVNSESG